MIRPTLEQTRHFTTEGYLVLPEAVAGNQLRWLQAAFERHANETHADWLEGVATGAKPGAFFDIPNPLDRDPQFIDLVDHPSYIGLLLSFCDNEILFISPQFRTVPPSPLSYVGWHYDVDRKNTPTHLKIQLYIDDVSEDGGPFAYVPGSHKPYAGPYTPVRHLESMPGHRTFPARAGTALLFHSYGMHTSMVNRTQNPRRSIILIYEKWSLSKQNSLRHNQLSQHLQTPLRRRLFGIER